METIIDSRTTAEQKHKSFFEIEPQRLMMTGYGLLTLSTAFFAVCDYFDIPNSDNGVLLFAIHYVMAFAFVTILITNNAYGFIRSWEKEHIHKTMLLLNLFLVSAYALNREITIFQSSTQWLCIYIVITSAAGLGYRFYQNLPTWAQAILQLVIGSALIFYTYLTLYTVEAYFLGTVGILVLGIGALIFVPLTLLIGTFNMVRHTFREHDRSFYWIIIGGVLTIGYAIIFSVEWNKRIEKIADIHNQAVMYPDAPLSPTFTIAQSIKPDWITVRMLKSDLVYTTNYMDNWDFMPRTTQWGEVKRHDPLVLIASLFSEPTLSQDERKEILKVLFNNRHEAEDRLWNGNDLTTSYVVSDVDIYPDLRIAFTEKYLNVRNSSTRSFRNQQEAIYTFQLPEGSVVTALSLWINGKEEKGILTSKEKAAEAYNKIVGVEVRDPSVVHWQEGNRITVRVFPCTPDEERKFKIGITSPLIEENGKLKLNNISFVGPDHVDAKETVRVRFPGYSNPVSLPDNFRKNAKGDYVSEDSYNPDLEITIDALPLKPNQFTFDGYSYSIKPLETPLRSVSVDKIYLDINHSWTDDELETLKHLIGKKDVFVSVDNEFIKLNADNFNSITDAAQQLNFSLFPFYNLVDASHSLLVTKGTIATPHLSDLKGSIYAANTEKYFARGREVKVFNLQGGTAAYISSIRELRGLEFTEGSASNLVTLIGTKQFPIVEESKESIALHEAHLQIIRKDARLSTMQDNAPDHLARLFTYNNIMRQVGTRYYSDDFVNADLVEEAQAAYVVSPVSSLVVLEKQEDYERFNIKDSKNSLYNAAKQSSGAVPEPHEWALIVLFAMVAVYLMIKR